jgi:glycosyltransferase involved in cell wall biosynthesis
MHAVSSIKGWFMKLFGFAMVKNEADIIESFVRVNCKVLDEIHFIDDGSTDNTVFILESLRVEGYNINIHYHELIDVQQQSSLLNDIISKTRVLGWDFAILLDADEFLIDNRNEFEKDLSVLKGKYFGLLEWLTFIPAINNSAEPNSYSLHNSFKPSRNELKNTHNYKVVVPRELVASKITISAGNHCVLTEKPTRETHVILKTRLAHIPVRTVNQFICKAILGSHTLSIKKNRLPGEAGHWDILADAVREKNFKLSFKDLQSFAFSYQSSLGLFEEKVLLSSPLIPDVGKLKYTDIGDINILKAVDAFCSTICKRLHSIDTDCSRPVVIESDKSMGYSSNHVSMIKSIAKWIKG